MTDEQPTAADKSPYLVPKVPPPAPAKPKTGDATARTAVRRRPVDRGEAARLRLRPACRRRGRGGGGGGGGGAREARAVTARVRVAEVRVSGPSSPRRPRPSRRCCTDEDAPRPRRQDAEEAAGPRAQGPAGRPLPDERPRRPRQTQIAVLEGRSLIEHYVRRPADDVSQIHGNIYLGRVQNVLPGMEAAFVDIGTPKNAVLYRGDVQLRRRGHRGEGHDPASRTSSRPAS